MIIFLGNTSNSQCVENCPGITLADPTTMSCILTKCPTWPSLFGYNNKCIEKCPATTYAHPVDRVCATECIQPFLMDDSTKRCV